MSLSHRNHRSFMRIKGKQGTFTLQLFFNTFSRGIFSLLMFILGSHAFCYQLRNAHFSPSKGIFLCNPATPPLCHLPLITATRPTGISPEITWVTVPPLTSSKLPLIGLSFLPIFLSRTRTAPVPLRFFPFLSADFFGHHSPYFLVATFFLTSPFLRLRVFTRMC